MVRRSSGPLGLRHCVSRSRCLTIQPAKKITMKANKLVAPILRSDGSCPCCANGSGSVCAWHRQEAAKQDLAFGRKIRRTVYAMRSQEVARLCSMHEIESDEAGSREDKASRMLGVESFSAYCEG